MVMLRLAAALAIVAFAAGSVVKQYSCDFEDGGLCGWQLRVELVPGITAGVLKASNTLPPAPAMDYNPGTVNGSYFFFNDSNAISMETQVLVFPTQKHIVNVSFAYYITSSLELTVIQENVQHVIIEFNQTGSQTSVPVWERGSYVLAPPATTGGIVLSVGTFDLGEGNLDPQSSPIIMGIDDVIMTFQLPCDYDMLNQPGNLVLEYPLPLQIPLGTVTHLDYNATSPICSTGPFVFEILSVTPAALTPIFSINSTTGVVTVNATGPHLLVQGDSGIVVVGVHVEDSDYTNSGSVFRRKHPLIFLQPATIVTNSPRNISVEINKPFSYTVEAESALEPNANLKFNNITTVPQSLVSVLQLVGSNVTGVVTYQALGDIAQLNGLPSFSVQVMDSFGGILTHTVQLVIPQMPPIFSSAQYTFNVTEESTVNIQGLYILDPNGDTCLDLLSHIMINTSDLDIHADFHIMLETFYPSPNPPFCNFLILSTVVLDYESRTTYSFRVVATDSQEMSSSADVTINVLPVNEYSPMFTVKMVVGEINELTPVGSQATTLLARDRDDGDDGTLSFEITAGNSPPFFRIVKSGSTTAVIEVDSSPVSPGIHTLTVVVSDGGDPPRTDTATATITVIASTTINCSTAGLGPPQLIGPSIYSTMQAIHSTVTLRCNHTANPPSFPIVWFHQHLATPLQLTAVIPNNHYIIANTSLTLVNVTTTDNGNYICNVTNTCGYVKRTLQLLVIDYPYPPTNVSIIEGPSRNNVTLSWVPPADSDSTHPVSGYVVKMWETGQTETVQEIHLQYVMAGATKTSSVVVKNLQPGTSYTMTVAAMNSIGETPAPVISFVTLFSAPHLSQFTASNHPGNQLLVDWKLDYYGGSSNVTMMVVTQVHNKPETRSVHSVSVDQESYLSPSLESGWSYDIFATVSTKYGSNQYTVTAFIGYTDNTTCSFGPSSTCQWQLQEANLTSAHPPSFPFPDTDAIGSTPAYYISGQPLTADMIAVQLIRYPTVSYVCGYSFYYQAYAGVRLVLRTTNGMVWWESGTTGTSDWQYVELGVGKLSPTVDESVGVEFVMERVGAWSTLSYAAVDEVTLHFCLPCNIPSVKLDHFTTSYPSFVKVYLRNRQTIDIETSVQGCPHAQLTYTILSVVPNELQSHFALPSSRSGGVAVLDITPDDAPVSTEGRLEMKVAIAQSDYKHEGVSVSDSISIRFVISERFQNCSFSSLCDFEADSCSWRLNNQTNIFINATETNNSFLVAYPPSSFSSSTVIEVWRHIINDSYCGLSFQYLARRTELQVTVDGLGTIWNSELAPPLSSNEEAWQSATVFIDIEGVEQLIGRGVEFEMVVYDDGAMGEGVQETIPEEVFVAVDNVTLNPCVDCQAKECSCISCIKQCTTDPCLPGYYLALEINRCRACPMGHYCTDWRRPPAPCPAGTYNNMTAAASVSQCRACPSGTISLQAGATACQSCPTGYMCRHPASFPVCDVMAVLSRCGPGYYYSSTSNGLTCTRCDPGYACYNGRRFLCPPGFFANQSGSTNCTVCPAGYHCSDSSQNPQKCSDGQYATQGSTECRLCIGSEPGSSNCTTTLASDVLFDKFVAGVMGGLIGIILMALLVTVCCACYCCCTRRRKQQRKERERQMYKENFLVSPDESLGHGRGRHTGKRPQPGTVSTIMSLRSLMSNTSASTTTSFKNAAYDDSDNESDEADETTSYRKTYPDQNNGAIDWRDTNPFIHTSPSESDMSIMVELQGEDDHVWPALARKAKKKESHF